MKKRAMKKYIPRDTYYCYKLIRFNKDSTPPRSYYCKNLVFDHVCYDTMIFPKEIGSSEIIEKPCTWNIYRCRYAGRTTLEDASLYDNCKCCEVGHPKEE